VTLELNPEEHARVCRFKRRKSYSPIRKGADRNNKVLLLSPSGGGMRGGGEKEKIRDEKYRNNPYTYEYNRMHYAVSC
jgi:hypothetical protein